MTQSGKENTKKKSTQWINQPIIKKMTQQEFLTENNLTSTAYLSAYVQSTSERARKMRAWLLLKDLLLLTIDEFKAINYHAGGKYDMKTYIAIKKHFELTDIRQMHTIHQLGSLHVVYYKKLSMLVIFKDNHYKEYEEFQGVRSISRAKELWNILKSDY